MLLILNLSAHSQHKIDTIPFSLSSKLLTFKAKINGVETQFAFDTGAGIGVLTKQQSVASRVSITGKKNIEDSNQNVSGMSEAMIDEITIGSFSIKNSKSVVYDMPFLSCNNYYLLGGNVINQLNWKFDFKQKLLFVSKEAFEPTSEMVKIPVKYKKNRHFFDFYINDKLYTNCLIDFGYSSFFEVSDDDKYFKKLKKEKEEKGEIINGKRFSQGLTSRSTTDYSAFLFDGLKLENTLINNIKVEIKENTENKIGIKFFTSTCNSLIINTIKSEYYVELLNKPVINYLSYAADCYYKDEKLIIVGKITAKNAKPVDLEIGEEIKSINKKTALDFKDECEFIKWQLENSTLSQNEIEKKDGKIILVEMQKLE